MGRTRNGEWWIRLFGACRRSLVLARLLVSLLGMAVIVACQEATAPPPQEPTNTTSTDIQRYQTQTLTLPAIEEKPYIMDQVTLTNGTVLSLWYDGGGCRWQVNQDKAQWIKPLAPCRWVRSPGTTRVQIFQADKNTRVLAVVGTSVGKRADCGQEVVGFVVRGKTITMSETLLRGSVYCANNGLDNFQYMLFAKTP